MKVSRMRHYVTYCDIGYAARALVLAESLYQHHHGPYELIVVCFDEITRLVIEKLALGRVSTVALHKVERRFPELHRCRRERTTTEYCWTLSAPVLLYVLESRSDIEWLMYSDADCAFFDDPGPVYDEIEGASVMIHEHRFQASMYQGEDPMAFGRYNVGLMGFRRDDVGFEVLRWWTQCNLDWCYARTEDGKFGDQKYLDDWPERFDGVHVLRQAAAGAAPWNHQNDHYQVLEPGPLINQKRLIHYHFHQLKFWSENQIVPLNTRYKLTPSVLEAVYYPYMKRLIYWRGVMHKEFSGLMPEKTAGGEALAVNNDTIVTLEQNGAWTKTSIRQEALRSPRSVKHLVGSLECAIVRALEDEGGALADVFALRAKLGRFILQFLERDGSNEQSAPILAELLSRPCFLLQRFDGDQDREATLMNRSIVKQFKGTHQVSDAMVLVGALYNSLAGWPFRMQQALFARSWPEWFFSVMPLKAAQSNASLEHSVPKAFLDGMVAKLAESRGLSVRTISQS